MSDSHKHKLVAIADAHVHPWPLQSRDGGHDRMLDGLRAVRQSLQLAREQKATWVFAGDMKQPKTRWPQSALTGLHAMLRAYADVVKVMVAGNHDAQGEGGSGLSPFKDVATVVDDGVSIVVPKRGPTLVCAPWDADPSRAADLLARVPHPKVLVAHGFIAGCLLGPEDLRIAKGAPIEAYGEFDLAVFGDVHKAQYRRPTKGARLAEWVAMPSGPFEVGSGTAVYCGDPYEQNWGERNDGAKGALLIDLMAQTVALHPTVETPHYLQVELSEENLIEFLDQLDATDSGDFVRVIYTGRAHDGLHALAEWGERQRSFQLIVRRPQAATSRAQIHAGMPMRELLESYVAARPPVTGIPPAKAVEAGLRLAAEETE